MQLDCKSVQTASGVLSGELRKKILKTKGSWRQLEKNFQNCSKGQNVKNKLQAEENSKEVIGKRMQEMERNSTCNVQLSIYDLLRVPPTASMEEIQRRLKNWALWIQPDKRSKQKS